jgi:MFS family permease
MRDLFLDISPLRISAPYRRLWIGSLLSAVGTALTMFALPLQVWYLTHSSFQVGLLSAVQLAPAITIGLLGGAWADARDRRRLTLGATFALVSTSAALAAAARSGSGLLWLIYAIAAVRSGLTGITAPARRTFIPALLPADKLAAGLALDRLGFQLMLIIGPALAGVIVAVPALGLRGCYLIDAITFGGSLYGLGHLPMSPVAAGAPSRTIRAVREGLAFIVGHPRLAGAFLADLSATVFALPVSLFPAINAQRFGGDPHTLGLFTAAIGVGGMASTLLSGPIVRLHNQGWAMLVAVCVWGGAFAAFAVVPGLALTLLMLGIAGAADTITVVMRGSIVQMNTPEAMRGRVTAVDYVVGICGSQLGNLEAGAVGSLTSPVLSAVAGGLATIVAAAMVAAAIPGFVRRATLAG